MTEQVTRHRGAGRDENGKLTAEASSVPLDVIGVSPGGGPQSINSPRQPDRGRTGEDVVYTVYFRAGTDVVNTDELTVRGERFRIMVNDWFLGRGGLEVVCVRGQG
ncbi:hypothetical protein [Mycolicibacterium sp.]|uniref:hypothetical protein n=1 Tax=Mycolicibacterium sp. TaxID=2320850 RepID=UPI0037C8B863